MTSSSGELGWLSGLGLGLGLGFWRASLPVLEALNFMPNGYIPIPRLRMLL